MQVKVFTFNDFYENTYVLYDDTKECLIIDPGCNSYQERQELRTFIEQKHLTPVKLLNTHCHIDHILGNYFVSDHWKLSLAAHKGEIPVLESGTQIAQLYNIYYEPSPGIAEFIEHQDIISFGNTTLKALYTPGHSPASLSFYCAESGVLIAGDVLFRESIGRTDLPGGDYDTLIDSIRRELFILPDDTLVYPGHGPSTTIKYEKQHNPFLR
ncbi:MAG: MBL fold metallo-hydrolase [Saprospiraceae bacterium]|nr:MBL fold metallo-hydrolase [Saprospiraceae bacterium]